MNTLIKKIIFLPLEVLSSISTLYSYLISILKPSFGNYWLDKQAEKNKSLIKSISHKDALGKLVELKIYTPNWICRFRADTFSTKEPETLNWIDKYGDGGTLFDIGANVGLYSIYYAKTKPGNVYAFEPSVFNLAQLAKNIHINGTQNKIQIITNPLTQENQFADFNLSTIDEGGALSAFGVGYGQDGNALAKKFSYKTLGLSLDFLMKNNILPEQPSMIKMDVDGIEHLIIEGAKETLKNKKCKTILIEVNDRFKEQAHQITKILSECGFVLDEKIQSDIIADSGAFSGMFNQIWIKK
ncbi:MAG: FkbM family methyltransferase [Elusimicrobiota bacterium]